MLLWFLLSTLACQRQATASSYISGRELHRTTPEVHEREYGFFFSVPIDYRRPRKGWTNLYAHFAFGPYDAKRPTVVFFNGGPGLTSHGDMALTTVRPFFEVGYNVLLIDQRGLGYSRPERQSLYDQPNFYGHHQTASDAEVLRRHLGLATWTVAGASYGTLPATVYASRFPAAVRAVVLSAAFIGDNSSKRHGAKFVARLLDQPVVAAYIEKIRRFRSPSDDAVATFAEFLESFVFIEGTGAISDFLTYMDDKEGFFFDPKELEATKDLLLGLDLFHHDLMMKKSNSFRLADYRIQAPTTYIHGTDDPRTPAAAAVRHFKSVPAGPAQMYLIHGASHLVLKSEIPKYFDPTPIDSPYPVSPAFVRMALDGEMVEPSACESSLGGYRRSLIARTEIKKLGSTSKSRAP